jgi:hypothetical protein
LTPTALTGPKLPPADRAHDDHVVRHVERVHVPKLALGAPVDREWVRRHRAFPEEVVPDRGLAGVADIDAARRRVVLLSMNAIAGDDELARAALEQVAPEHLLGRVVLHDHLRDGADIAVVGEPGAHRSAAAATDQRPAHGDVPWQTPVSMPWSQSWK